MKKKQNKSASKNAKNFYAFGTYKPNKNAVSVVYKGKTYLSKAQCMALEGITRKELDTYLNGEPVKTPVEVEETVVEATEEELIADEEQDLSDIVL